MGVQAMTQHVAYRWNGGVYCEDDIVAVFTEHFPWHVWLDTGGVPATADAETELYEIAHMFRIDRESPAEVARYGFPEHVGKHPGFCSWCHRWFEDD
jgi:hypothetical protein